MAQGHYFTIRFYERISALRRGKNVPRLEENRSSIRVINSFIMQTNVLIIMNL